MSGSRLDARIAGFTTFLLVVSAFMIGFGFVMPSPAVSTAPGPGYRPMAAPAAPVRLVVPALRIKAPVLPIQVNAQKVLDPPRDPQDVGWWDRSAQPGATTGQTVMTGHTVHTGGGVMDDLGRLQPGQLVRVVTRAGTMDYSATKVVDLTKAQLARKSVELFGQDRRDGRLVLITCSRWNGHEYLSNTVVFARPLGVREPADRM
jgi:LPXTG-site transpeptidase (sortase) family protein